MDITCYPNHLQWEKNDTMTLQISELDDNWQGYAVAYLRRTPYRNAIPLAHITQLRQRCDVVVAHRQGLIQGIASHYRDLPFLGITFVAEQGSPLPALLAALARRVPAMQTDLISTVVPEHRAQQLRGHVHLESVTIEWQMVVEPETLKPIERPGVRRLREIDLPAMDILARACGMMTWRPGVLANGPAFGAFVGEELVAMAATHFVTVDAIEIGNVATHPDYRQQGFAGACISALARAGFRLAPRIYLLVVIDHIHAIETYRRLGFWPSERFAFVRFKLS